MPQCFQGTCEQCWGFENCGSKPPQKSVDPVSCPSKKLKQILTVFLRWSKVGERVNPPSLTKSICENFFSFKCVFRQFCVFCSALANLDFTQQPYDSSGALWLGARSRKKMPPSCHWLPTLPPATPGLLWRHYTVSHKDNVTRLELESWIFESLFQRWMLKAP